MDCGEMRALVPTGARVILGPRERAARPKPGGYDYPSTKVGSTLSVDVLIANSLGTSGLTVAKSVLANVEDDFQHLQILFGNLVLPRVTCVVAPLSGTHDGTGGAYHYGCNGTVLYCDACFADPKRTCALFVAELSEVGQATQNGGWDCGATNGEGLSRVHAEALYPGSLDDFETASAWLDSGVRPDWVNKNEATDQDPVSNGCAVLFINWLAHLGHDYAAITQAAGDSLARTYQELTGKASAWADFDAACNARWPLSKPSGVTTDNPWGPVNPPPPPPPPSPPTPTQATLTVPAGGLPGGTYNVVPQTPAKRFR